MIRFQKNWTIVNEIRNLLLTWSLDQIKQLMRVSSLSFDGKIFCWDCAWMLFDRGFKPTDSFEDAIEKFKLITQNKQPYNSNLQ